MPASAHCDPELFQEAIQVAHVVNYADQCLTAASGTVEAGTNTIFEIQPLGSKDLQFRRRLGRGASKWMHLGAVAAPRVSDACGSGDWCTAGLLAKLTVGGQERMRGAGTESVREALRYGHALAAWDCEFEGTRGGMYAVDRTAFDGQMIGLLERQPSLPVAEVTPTLGSAVACPACPPDRPGSGPTRSVGARGVQNRLTAA